MKKRMMNRTTMLSTTELAKATGGVPAGYYIYKKQTFGINLGDTREASTDDSAVSGDAGTSWQLQA
jgi:hypothetical protein